MKSNYWQGIIPYMPYTFKNITTNETKKKREGKQKG